MNIENKILDYNLNALVDTYNIDNIYEQYKRFEFLKKLNNYIDLRKSTVLEFGSASGQMTEILSKMTKGVIAVDGSTEFIRIAKARVRNARNVKFYESYFEKFTLDEKVECLILHHVLEHLRTPRSLLLKVNSYLKKDGIVAISVPNAHALSRQLAVKMGLLNSIYDLTENDKNHGHFRIYDWKRLEEQLAQSGLIVIGRHGLSFKIFSDKQNIEMLNSKIIGEEQIKGLWQLADEFPEIAGAIMVVAKSDKK